MAQRISALAVGACFFLALLPWTTQGFALRLYNSEFAVKPLENATRLGSYLQPVRQQVGRYLPLKPIAQVPGTRFLGLLKNPTGAAGGGTQARPMLWDDCTDYKMCRARLINYLAAKINEQKQDSQMEMEPLSEADLDSRSYS